MLDVLLVMDIPQVLADLLLDRRNDSVIQFVILEH